MKRWIFVAIFLVFMACDEKVTETSTVYEDRTEYIQLQPDFNQTVLIDEIPSWITAEEQEQLLEKGSITVRISLKGYTPGTTWTSRTSGISTALYGVCYGNSLFCAVGAGGVILTSPNGVTWTSRTSGTVNDLYDVAWNGTVFCAVSGSAAYVSSNGTSWTEYAESQLSGDANNAFCYALNGYFYALSDASDAALLRSADGDSWGSSLFTPTSDVVGVQYNGTSLYLAMEANGYPWTSSDGSSWTRQATGLGMASYRDSLIFNGTYFMYVNSVNGTLLATSDGTSWLVNYGIPTSGHLEWGNGVYVWYAQSGTGTIKTSGDGVTWTSRTAASSNIMRGSSYSPELGMVILVGDGGVIQTSTY